MTLVDRSEPEGPRLLTAHDLSCLEELSEPALSPDGRRLAYVRKRARNTATFHKHDFLSGAGTAAMSGSSMWRAARRRT